MKSKHRLHTFQEKCLLAMVPPMAHGLMRLWFGSIRVDIIDQAIYERYVLNGSENLVAGTWHRHLLFLVYYFRSFTNKALMVSQSNDGELMARLSSRLGYRPIRGSSSRGGRAALKAMIDFMGASGVRKFCGTAVDGPRGPARHLKPGMLVLAQMTGAHFIPVACSGTRLITFTRAWDQTILPMPFSRMVIAVRPPVPIPRSLSAAEFEKLRVKIERTLNELTEQVDRVAGYVSPDLRGPSSNGI